MPFVSTHRQQQLVYLAITIVILVLAVGLLRWQEDGHHRLSDQINRHQLILFESSRIKQELAQLQLYISYRESMLALNNQADPSTWLNLYGSRFKLSVSLYEMAARFDTLSPLLQQVGAQGKFYDKLKLQIERFESLEPLLRSNQPADLEKGSLFLQGLALSIEQLEGLHNLQFKQLTETLDANINRDNRILIVFLASLVIFSYLLIKWISDLIEKNRNQFTAELEVKNSELERFVYTASHELRSPLVTIKGFVGLLEKDLAAGDREKVKDDLERISQAADVMSDLLSGLLELSRIGQVIGPPARGSLDQVVHNAVDILQANISQRSVTLEIQEGMPDYWGDELRITEVFQNLIENSIKFMGDQPSPRVRVGARLDGQTVICEVEDNGVGIDPNYHERIFGLFERLDPGIEGTGIGMPVVKRIIEAHGGSISVVSAGIGRGCKLIFTLPAGPGPAMSASPPGESSQAD